MINNHGDHVFMLAEKDGFIVPVVSKLPSVLKDAMRAGGWVFEDRSGSAEMWLRGRVAITLDRGRSAQMWVWFVDYADGRATESGVDVMETLSEKLRRS